MNDNTETLQAPSDKSETITQTPSTTGYAGESKFVCGKSQMSARSLLVIMMTATLCLLVGLYPTDFKETFAAAVGTAIGFYFAQNNKQK